MPKKNTGLGLGIHTIPSDAEKIPSQASQDSLGWISTDGAIELSRGRFLLGSEETDNWHVQGHGFGYTANGVAVQFRKINTKIQYFDGSIWQDTITGLTADAEYTFAQYQSLAGTFVFATGIDGIYKIHVANPGDYTDMYDAAKNFKAKSIITDARMLMWDLPNDKSGLYGSYIDAQDAAVYTTVASEALANSATGTLAFKAADALRTCFGLVVTVTGSGQVFTDDYNGNLIGDAGGVGTINYMTGAFTTDDTGAGTAAYQWEMTNNNGITDFTKSTPRQAGQGFVFRQDEGGDPILNVTTHNDSYYSLKSRSAYKLTLSATDDNASNGIFRRNIGLPYWRGTVTTRDGIMFMDTANVEKPQLTILTENAIGDRLEPITLAQQFDFSKYNWDNCAMNTFGEYVVFSGKSLGAGNNDRLFIYNVRRKSIDVIKYDAKTIVQDWGKLYIGDTTTENVYEIFSGFDDDGETITNHWISGEELFGTYALKKSKRFRIKGIISKSQSIEIFFSPDGSEHTLIGTIKWDGSYVDYTANQTIGSNGIGASVLGGDVSHEDGSFYLAEIKVSQTKYRKRSIKLVATGIGYVSVDMYGENKLQKFMDRLPSRYRSKQNVSKDGTQTDMPNPT